MGLFSPSTLVPVTHWCYLSGFRKRLKLWPVFQGSEGPEKSCSREPCLTSLSLVFPTMTALWIAFLSLHPLPSMEPEGPKLSTVYTEKVSGAYKVVP